MSIVLGIESSCDETGVAVVEDGRRVLANRVASQIDVHREFGGVVPEIASRQHTKIISQLVAKAFEDAGIEPGRAGTGVDGIAATRGPGLMGSLLVGFSFARALARVWERPFIPVHHIEGHIFSVMLDAPGPEFPFLALVVSGGHTQLIDCAEPHGYRILGTTRDDAVGESFDKVAKMLGLEYPGGPSIQKAAATGNPEAFDFPRAMTTGDSLDFSYSGLKTAVLYALRQAQDADTADVAASFQAAAVDVLMIKTRKAIAQTGHSRIVLAGGVAANRLLRDRLVREMDAEVFLPPFKYCVDNGAMIAAAAASRMRHGLEAPPDAGPDSGLRL
jgi:N6-L-threonylcarbamoyladenine synthase